MFYNNTKKLFIGYSLIIDKTIVSLWTEKRIRLEMFIIFSVIFFLIGKLPYFNLVLSFPTNYLILFILAVILFDIKKEKILIINLILYGIALLFTLVHKNSVAESIGNGVYFLMIIIVFYYLKDLWKTKTK